MSDDHTYPNQPHDDQRGWDGAPYGTYYGPQPGYGYPPPGMYRVDPHAPYGYDPYGRVYSAKTKLVAGLLQIFVGTFGTGRWYTGHYGLAVAQLLTCGGFFIWALIDGIYLLAKEGITDSDGRVLRTS
ncbi:TM2 domain-containing protein [Streptomyces sp. ACA25]|uniref:TM2 domain-containing protein n=1 Tax=Streptomyces sp. ACA25 TaxID=3022596 RepID=UPI002308225B|nr:TM2 domain-containing protein [Streptomyces sp. ACA25]MDB1086535.1 TM2 domain-containing protein [Streptomyces sp. ACA25]